MSAIASEAPHRGRFLSGGFFSEAFFNSPSLRSSLKVSPKKHNKEFFFWKVGLFRIDMKMHARMYFDLRDFSFQTLVVAFFFDMLHMFCWLYEKFQIWYFRKKFFALFALKYNLQSLGPNTKKIVFWLLVLYFCSPMGFLAALGTNPFLAAIFWKSTMRR